jgi:predicted ATPase/DNA-binding SARP family transcriptional activator
LLGTPAVYSDEGQIQFSRKKSIALLAYLAIEGGACGRDSLATLLWPRCGQKQARTNLRACLFDISAALGTGVLDARRETVALIPDSIEVDAIELIRKAAPCPDHRADMACDRCVSGLLGAIELYRGVFMEGFTLTDSEAFDSWETERENEFGEAYAAALSRGAAWKETHGEAEKAIELLAFLRKADPYDEAALRSLMRLCADSGKAAMAIDRYREYKVFARKELGGDPEPETEALYEEIAGKHHPAKPGSAMVGRSDSEAEVRAALASSEVRLCTITGMGGIGKTRLAQAIVASPGPKFPDGAIFIDLSAIGDAALVLPEIAAALRVSQRSMAGETIGARLAAHIGEKRLLVALDNFEQVVAAAPAVRALQLSCPGLVVLATSRIALGIEGEVEIPLSPLCFPQETERCAPEDIDRYPSMRLFANRAFRADPDFQISSENIALVARLCGRLEGVPLAIELAASRLSALSIAELYERVQRGFSVVKANERAAPSVEGIPHPPRHRSLHEVVAWSWRLLAKSEQRFLERLSVFRGGFDFEAAEAICGESAFDGGIPAIDRLDALATWHLVMREEVDGRKRYRLPEAIRAYAEDQLDRGGSGDALRRIHALYYLKLAKSLGRALHGPYQRRTLLRMQREHGNWTAAQDFLFQRGAIEETLDFCDALEWYWYRSGRFSEGRIALSRAFGMASGDRHRAARGRAIRACAWLDLLLGEWGAALEHYREAVATLRTTDDIPGLARALSGFGVTERWMGETEAGIEHGLEAVRLVAPEGDPLETARALIWVFANTGGRRVAARQEEGLGEALALAREARDPWLEAHALEGLGDYLRENADAASSIPCYEESLRLFQEVDDDWMLAWVYEGLGMAALKTGHHDLAESRLFRSLGLFQALGDRGDVAYVLGELGLACEARGDQARADFLFGVFFSMLTEESIAASLSGRRREPRPGWPAAELPSAFIPAKIAPSIERAGARSTPSWQRGRITSLDRALELLVAKDGEFLFSAPQSVP